MLREDAILKEAHNTFVGVPLLYLLGDGTLSVRTIYAYIGEIGEYPTGWQGVDLI